MALVVSNGDVAQRNLPCLKRSPDTKRASWLLRL